MRALHEEKERKSSNLGSLRFARGAENGARGQPRKARRNIQQ
jgi:hypothetical protein